MLLKQVERYCEEPHECRRTQLSDHFGGVGGGTEGEGGEDGEDNKNLIYSLGNCPHDWLFGHCRGVIHHGGAGTVAAGLRAGKPTFICPFFGDQFFWGQVVYR